MAKKEESKNTSAGATGGQVSQVLETSQQGRWGVENGVSFEGQTEQIETNVVESQEGVEIMKLSDSVPEIKVPGSWENISEDLVVDTNPSIYGPVPVPESYVVGGDYILPIPDEVIMYRSSPSKEKDDNDLMTQIIFI